MLLQTPIPGQIFFCFCCGPPLPDLIWVQRLRRLRDKEQAEGFPRATELLSAGLDST